MDTTTDSTQTAPETIAEPTGRATYCPEDNKLRLYVGRVPRDEYEALRRDGWTPTPKQDCDFVAHWTPSRRDTALDYSGGVIEDEDMSPAERAADRAERFGGYREKRLGEALGHADRYDSQPGAHGFQSMARAERAAARHDRIGTRAVDAWDKAEYWQRRTAGVISHALHVCSPSVRMGRIKELEAEIRKAEKNRAEYNDFRAAWAELVANATASHEAKQARAELLAGSRGYWQKYAHPDSAERVADLSDLLRATYAAAGLRPITPDEAAELYLARNGELSEEGDWLTHYRNRLAYENQMLEAQGGRAGVVEMIAGGFIQYTGRRARASVWVRIQRVNKSPTSGRVTSVMVKAAGDQYGNTSEGFHLAQINVERMAPESYRAPTPEELAEFETAKKAEKKAAKAAKPAPAPLINPTDEDAARLVEMWNAARREKHEAGNTYTSESARAMHSAQFKPCEVRRMPQAFYSAHSKGSYAKAETRALCSLGRLEERSAVYDYSGQAQRAAARGPAVCEIRTTGFDPVHVIILTDKPQKPLPAAVWLPYFAPVTVAAAELVTA